MNLHLRVLYQSLGQTVAAAARSALRRRVFLRSALSLSTLFLPVPSFSGDGCEVGRECIINVPGMVCADGTPSFITLKRRASANKVLISLRHGGACWSEKMCRSPIWAHPMTREERVQRWHRGIFDESDSRNPFADGYDRVTIPYCTGDVHAGDTTVRYGAGLSIRHRGYENVRLAFREIQRRYTNPEKVVLAGCSAGGLGALYHLRTLREFFPSSRKYVIDDAGTPFKPPYVNAEEYERIRTLWGMDRTAGRDENGNSIHNFADLVYDNSVRFPDTRFAFISTYRDVVMNFFFQAAWNRPGAINHPSSRYGCGRSLVSARRTPRAGVFSSRTLPLPDSDQVERHGVAGKGPCSLAYGDGRGRSSVEERSTSLARAMARIEASSPRCYRGGMKHCLAFAGLVLAPVLSTHSLAAASDLVLTVFSPDTTSQRIYVRVDAIDAVKFERRTRAEVELVRLDEDRRRLLSAQWLAYANDRGEPSHEMDARIAAVHEQLQELGRAEAATRAFIRSVFSVQSSTPFLLSHSKITHVAANAATLARASANEAPTELAVRVSLYEKPWQLFPSRLRATTEMTLTPENGPRSRETFSFTLAEYTVQGTIALTGVGPDHCGHLLTH